MLMPDIHTQNAAIAPSIRSTLPFSPSPNSGLNNTKPNPTDTLLLTCRRNDDGNICAERGA